MLIREGKEVTKHQQIPACGSTCYFPKPQPMGSPRPPQPSGRHCCPLGQMETDSGGESSAALGLERGTARAEPRLLPRPQLALLPVTVSSAALGQPLWKGEGKARDPGDCPDA